MRHPMRSVRSSIFAKTLVAALLIVSSGRQLRAEGYESHFSDLPYARLFESAPPSVETPPDFSRALYQGPEQPPPKPVHAGFGSLVRNIGGDFKAFPQRKSTWVILGIGGLAAAAVHPVDDEFNDHIQGSDTATNIFKPGKYIGYGWVQAGVAVGTYTIGRIRSKNDGTPNKLEHIGFDLLRANVLTQSLTYAVKLTVRRDRPTGECCSFPSGHASVSFAVASVLERHFGYRAAWPTFLIAGYVAASRLVDNRHFLSDVLFGSALGMASGWTVVGRHGHDSFALMPVKTPGGIMIALTKVNASSSQK
jgi:hypothetical protein